MEAEQSIQSGPNLAARIAIGLALFLALALLAVIWLLFGNHGPGIPIGPETTYITEPIDADGYVDYAAALRDEEVVPAEKNAAGPLLSTVMDQVSSSFEPSTFHDVCKDLGISHVADPEKQLIDWYDFFPQHSPSVKYAENSEANPSGEEIVAGPIWEELRIQNDKFRKQMDNAYFHCLDNPWTADEYPLMAEWVATNTVALEQITTGASRPEYQFQPARDDAISHWVLPLSQAKRSMARALVVRALKSLGEGDIDATITESIHSTACPAATTRPAR